MMQLEKEAASQVMQRVVSREETHRLWGLETFMAGDTKLRPHQVEAVEAVVSGLEIRSGQRIPENGLRGQVHAACGTGKTFIAAAAAQRIAPRGRVLVLVPTLALLSQTVREWREFGHAGPMVAVCSMQDDPRL
ncbi:DEAD/DEAH box helicase family protein [Streptomyces genisteinicus]|uniref:DEAD/DEAH box helicase family protein n=1 Tax=Streptomyces genisteinicus TaxID=2768068 RepID=A0A7H0HLP7_9ACTN|nr:DEAD/DEAH box helicase family protein [Streptomyces genisteinicus]